MSEDSSRAVWLPQARSYLRHADPVLARLIDDRPDFDHRAWLAQLPPMDLYGALLFQVTGQQLSVPATRRTLARIQALFGGHLPAPAELLAVDPGQLRQAGLSWRKIGTLRDLAERMADGRLDQDVLSTLPDGELMAELTAIPDIGPWTVQGAMLIALQREDVALPGDLALRKAVQAALSAGTPAHPGGGPGHRREMAALPQPGDQLPVLRRLRTIRGTTGRPAQERLNVNGGCTHLDRIHDVTPSSWGCEDCLAQGRQDWVHLRVCQECGHVGCCDNSPGRHATAHFHVAGHPVIRSYEPGEDWYWCYLDQLVFELQGAPPAPSHP